jgi:phosphopantothenoylcysteine decarboxylase/phosphopantothenate--cysteine ligase
MNPMNVLTNKKVLFGICGGIAAYKTPGLVRELRKLGADIRVVMTRNATRFIGPITLQAISGYPVRIDMFDPKNEDQISHIDLARWADVVLVAPATANLVGHVANGLADDLLSTLLLATTAPVLIAPSMNTKMLQHPMVQRNLERIANTAGLSIIEPDEGELACLETGPGRLPDADFLIDAIIHLLSPKPLAEHRILVTLGPTREWVDDVRFLSNPSSGRMGFAICRSARHLGAQVIAVADRYRRIHCCGSGHPSFRETQGQDLQTRPAPVHESNTQSGHPGRGDPPPETAVLYRFRRRNSRSRATNHGKMQPKGMPSHGGQRCER